MRTRWLLRWGIEAVLFAALIMYAATAAASTGDANPFDEPDTPFDLSSEIKFFKVESDVVTSVSRHPESLWGAAAAIYVIRGEEIIASGANSITDALRMVPGVDVADLNRTARSISARGYTGVFADKMLVLLDGRPIYTPLFGGTIWEMWETFLPDIDRIEVIRGPGGALYGSNAVNGVVNIITKSAEDTQGTLVRGIAGTNSYWETEGRVGSRIGETSYRVFGRWEGDQGFGGNGGRDIPDEHEEYRTGYRADHDFGRGLMLHTTGEFYRGRFATMARSDTGAPPPDPDKKMDETLYTTMWRLEKDFANGSQAHLQAAGDYVELTAPFLGSFENRRSTWEVEGQHSLRVTDNSRLTYGVNFRRTTVDTKPGIVSFDLSNGNDTLNVLGGFVNLEVALGDRTQLTLGSKVENNSFTGTNFQPSVRIAYRPDDDRTLWAAVSRAVNIPAFSDMFVTILGTPDTTTIPGSVIIPVATTDGTVPDTTMISFELGYRYRFNERLSNDVTVFYNDYDHHPVWDPANAVLVPPACAGGTCQAVTLFTDAGGAYGYGLEDVVELHLRDWWKSELNFSFHEFSRVGADNPDVPQWKVNLRQTFHYFPQWTVIPTLHWVDGFESESLTGVPLQRIPGYLRTDLAINYKRKESWPTISLVGQNITKRSHIEFNEELISTLPTPVTRMWYLRVQKEF